MKPERLLLSLLCLLAACSDPSARTQAQPASAGAAATLSLNGPPLPEPGRVPSDAASLRLSFAPVVKRVIPAVVNVYSRRTERQMMDPFWQRFLPSERVAHALGSGVIVRADGIIVTNNHVVAGADEIMVALADRRQFPAKLVMADPRADIAVLKINVGAEHLPVLALNDRDDVQVGDLVLAIGDPFGVGQTVTNGIVSALARSDVGITDVSYFIQTDAAINPGNSGGALVDMNGDMIGMNTAIASQSGTSSGVGFAIPAALIKRVVEAAISGRGPNAARPWLGLKAQEVTADIAKSLGLDRPEGVLITDVFKDGPADKAGLKQGDLILTIDGQPVNDESALNYRVVTRPSGEVVALKVRREKGALETVRVRIVPPPGDPARAASLIEGKNPLGGATVVEFSPAVAEQLGVDAFSGAHGVLITNLGESYAANLGLLQVGDVIVAVNGRAITTVAALRAALEAPRGGWMLVVQRGGQTITMRVGL